jgi:hypothetical protein
MGNEARKYRMTASEWNSKDERNTFKILIVKYEGRMRQE